MQTTNDKELLNHINENIRVIEEKVLRVSKHKDSISYLIYVKKKTEYKVDYKPSQVVFSDNILGEVSFRNDRERFGGLPGFALVTLPTFASKSFSFPDDIYFLKDFTDSEFRKISKTVKRINSELEKLVQSIYTAADFSIGEPKVLDDAVLYKLVFTSTSKFRITGSSGFVDEGFEGEFDMNFKLRRFWIGF